MQIYKIINSINGKIYVGQDSSDRPDYFGSGKLIRLAIKKYGIENFRKEILETCQSREEMQNREIFWIKKLNAIDKNVGYNIRLGGEGIAKGTILDEIHRNKITQSLKLKWEDSMFREMQSKKMHSEIRNRKIGEGHRGKPLSEAGIQALKNRKLNKLKHQKTCENISHGILSKELLFWKKQDLSLLDERMYSIISLKYFKNISILEISEKFELSPSVINSLIHNLKKNLQNANF